MYKDIFIELGLNPNEAIIYEYLLKNGESPAGKIITKTPLKRGVTYNILADLVKKGLITQKIKNKVAFFSPNHPEKLRTFIESKENELNKAKNTLEANLSQIVSDFNLISGRPGVRYFEGIEGVKKVLWDSLNTKGEIFTYADIETIQTYIEKINQKYVETRDQLGIKKRAILLDSPYARSYLGTYHRQITDMKFIDYQKFPFSPIVEIYDNKVSYVTLTDDIKIGVIIEDKNINQLHRSLFEFTWQHALNFDQLTGLSKTE